MAYRYTVRYVRPMLLTCTCGASMPMPARGRIPTYCSTRCRVAAHRTRRRDEIPAELRECRRWTRRVGKRPVTVTGRPGSSTDQGTWSTFAAVQRSRAGDGIGVMLGDGLACYDLDHCLEDGVLSECAQQVLAEVDPIYTEVSMSGTGLHVFVRAPEGKAVRTEGVEFYSRARFIAVTGHRWEPVTTAIA